MARSLKGIALVVTLGTLLSKLGGLVRQLVIAAAFGVGAAYDAYNYAYVLPGFLLILLGGINGPFHSAMVSVLSRRPRLEGAHILAALNTSVSLLLLLVTAVLVLAADPLITLVGPGLSPELHGIATVQLRVMAPMALLAGLIGLGFGSLNAADEFWIPAVSPLMSSAALILGVGLLWWQLGSGIALPAAAMTGGVVLALATLVGALLQWLIQLPALIRQGLARFQLIWDFRHPGVREVWQVMGPATLSSGMLQINVFTDLFFASGIVGAAAGLGYANLLVQTPLGLISNALLVPLLPTFARLTALEDRPQLIARIRQGLMVSTASMVPLGGLFIALGAPIVGLVYERGAFDASAAQLVTGLLMAYGLGMPAYLGRDVLVRVFYALGDGTTPFRLSLAGIGLNVIFDWLLVGGPTPWGNQSPVNFGAPGLVLATVLINGLTCVALLVALRQRLPELPVRAWANDSARLGLAGLTAAAAAWIPGVLVAWPSGLIGLMIQITGPGLLGLALFFLTGRALGVAEVSEITRQLRRRIRSR